MSQGTLLLSSTIQENLCYGNPNASDEQVNLACQTAGIADFISGLPASGESAWLVLEKHGAGARVASKHSGGMIQIDGEACAMIQRSKQLAALYLVNPEVNRCAEDKSGNAVLINPDSGASLSLNSTAILLWQALARPHTQKQMVAYYHKNCAEVVAEQVEADVEAFIQNLLPRGVIGQYLEQGLKDFYFPEWMGSEDKNEESENENSDAEIIEENRLRFYRGRSMLGTFQPGDQINLEAVSITAIRRGDIVVYRGRLRAGKPTEVVHRVVAISSQGLTTQGDANTRVDAVPISADRLVGRVISRGQAGRIHRVSGGNWGFRYMQIFQSWQTLHGLLDQSLRWVGRLPYNWLRASGLVGRLWHPAILLLLVMTERGPLVKFIVGQRTVARWWPINNRFSCRQPYDLLISSPDKMELHHDQAKLG